LSEVAVVTVIQQGQSEPSVEVEDLAEHLSLAKDIIYKWIASRNLTAHRVGRLWKFKVSEVNERIRAGKAADLNDAQKRDGEVG
jgi:excisionase family DNA binding protein